MKSINPGQFETYKAELDEGGILQLPLKQPFDLFKTIGKYF